MTQYFVRCIEGSHYYLKGNVYIATFKREWDMWLVVDREGDALKKDVSVFKRRFRVIRRVDEHT